MLVARGVLVAVAQLDNVLVDDAELVLDIECVRVSATLGDAVELPNDGVAVADRESDAASVDVRETDADPV